MSSSAGGGRASRWLLRRYGPFVALGCAVALVVGIAPSSVSEAPTAYAGYQPVSGAAGSPSPRTTGPGCARMAFLGATAGCERQWAGHSNGGATYKGVSGSQVNVVYYEPELGSQLTSIAQSAGSASPAEERHAIEVYARFFNRYFQTYGRHVNVQPFFSTYPVLDAAASRADAITADQKYRAFAALGGVSSDFMDETARRGIFSISAVQMPQSFYASHRPFVYGLLPSTDTTINVAVEYIQKKLGVRSVARFGGHHSSPPVDGRRRRYGIVYPTTNQDGTPSIYASVGAQMRDKMVHAGIVAPVTIGYSLDYNSSQTQSTNIVQQLRSAGVTTVVCLCDPITPIFLTKAASQQGYYPEYLQTGFFYQDAYQLARLYDQAQWSHNFGVSSLPLSQNPQDTEAWKVWKSVEPSTDPPLDAELIFGQLELTFGAIELAGPRLDPKTFSDAMFSIDLRSNSPYEPTYYYSRNDYGGIKDYQEIWWDPNAMGPDGVKGNYESVDGGYRYLPGHWPATPTRVFDPACLAPRSCGAPWYH